MEGAVSLYSLEADELPELKLFLMDPALHIRDYAPDIRAHLSEVDAVSADQVRVLVVVNTAQGELGCQPFGPGAGERRYPSGGPGHP
ncbi:flagellar assembly protein FliW [Nesterenkonia pannonica]|uniref:flagellar assembly protein FliW n=1 Tax=Nesterenkonia pannonica TaxID=1548602 RepID=UPI00216446D6|nr:flagellar assembly protein FliW [Nesterenkonia pannonica]